MVLRTGGVLAIAVTAQLSLAGCGAQTPEDARAASIQRCERQFGQMAPDPSLGTEMCACMVDRLAEEGMEVTDALFGDRARVEEITRSCATDVGITFPA